MKNIILWDGLPVPQKEHIYERFAHKNSAGDNSLFYRRAYPAHVAFPAAYTAAVESYGPHVCGKALGHIWHICGGTGNPSPQILSSNLYPLII